MDYSSWSVPAQTISFLEANLMIVISVVFVLGFILIMRYSAKIVPALVGVLSYVVFGLLGTECVCMLAGSVQGIGRLIFSNVLGYCVFRAVILALMYHAARFLTVKIVLKENCTIGNTMAAGLGNAAGLAVVTGIEYMVSSALASTINELGIDAMLEGYDEQQTEMMIQSVTTLVTSQPVTYLLRGIATALDMAALVILCVFLYGILEKKLPPVYHWIIIGVNAAVILPTNLIEYYNPQQAVLFTIVKITIVVFMFWGMLYVDSRYLGKAFAEVNANKYQTTGHLPRMKK